MSSPKQPVIGSPAAGLQKHRHLNAKGLFKQRHHISSALQSAASKGALQTLAWMIRQDSKQLIEALLEQCLRWRHSPDVAKAQIQAVLADTKCLKNSAHVNWILQMQTEIVPRFSDDLHWASAGLQSSLRSLYGKGFGDQGPSSLPRLLALMNPS
ncbi:MAG: hypothetical protein ACO28M_06540 [Vulcanococcus sp.]